jgi:hypothetical protein
MGNYHDSTCLLTRLVLRCSEVWWKEKSAQSLSLPRGRTLSIPTIISYLVGVDPAAHFNQPEEALGVEALCLELGNKDGLQASYGNQALIVKAWGWLEEALELHKKKEALCIEVGNRSSLAYCYWNWGLLAREQRDRNTEREKLTAALKFSPI